MKFIHTGDICWGFAPDAGTRWSRERSRDIRETFADIVRKAVGMSADFLFISGNLFSGQPLSGDLRDVNAILAQAPALRTVIIAGTRDRITESSAVLGFPWASNVTFLYPDSSVYFDDFNLQVSGASLTDGGEETYYFDTWEEQDEDLHLLVIDRRTGKPVLRLTRSLP